MDPRIETQRIWNEFHARLLSFIRRRVESDADAEDILQDVFAAVHAHVHVLRDRDSVTSWVYRIARNGVMDHHRARARRRSAMESLARQSRAQGAPAARAHPPWGDEREARTDLARCIEPLLASLPEEYGRAVELTELRGDTQKAAARRLGLSVSGMKSRLQRGRRKLRDALTDCCRVHLDARKGVVGYDRRAGGGRDADDCRGAGGSQKTPSPGAWSTPCGPSAGCPDQVVTLQGSQFRHN